MTSLEIPKAETAGKRADLWTRLAGPALIVAFALVMLAITWRRWPDVLVDFGVQLYTAWQLSQGKLLYRDIAHVYGPLSPYLNALAFRLLGGSLMSLVALNLLILSGILALSYRVLLEIGGALAATAGCVAFVGIFAFGQYMPAGNYNFVTPYVAEATHGLLLYLAAAWLLHRYAAGGRRLTLVAAGLCAGLLLLTKYELILAGVAALAVQAGLIFFRGGRDKEGARQRQTRDLFLLILGVIIVPVIAFVALRSYLATGPALRAVAGAFPLLTHEKLYELSFYREGMGVNAPGENLLRMLKVLGWYALLLLPLAAAYANRRGRARWGMLAGAFVCVAVVTELLPIDWTQIGRPLPLFMVIAAVLAALKLRGKTASPADALRLGMIVFALVLLAKMGLNAHVYHYGFVLALPASLILITAMVAWIPRQISRRQGDGRIFMAAALAVVLVTIAIHVHVTRNYMAEKTFAVGRGADTILSAPARGRETEAAVEAVRALTPADATLAVVPEGAMINYLARRRNPTPYLAYLPSDLAMHGERRLSRAMAAHPPDFVLAIVKNQQEYGEGAFGKGYARELAGWIVRNYAVLMHPERSVTLLVRRTENHKGR